MNSPVFMFGFIVFIAGFGMGILSEGHDAHWRACKVALVGLVMMAASLLVSAALARDLEGRYANSELKQWFDGLKSGKGPCCSDADGSAISDADWETQSRPGSHYRVRIPGNDGKLAWIDVPDEAVITEPNRAGKTMVWPIRGYLGTSIRCFMPGVMI